MGEELRPDLFKSDVHRVPSSERTQRRAAHRRIFRDMIKIEVEDRPLRWLRRRELILFAQSLGIDAFEARLLIRAIEYECGHVVPAAMADVETPIEKAYLARQEVASPFIRFIIVLLSVIVIDAVLLRLLFALATQ
ncbi:MAG: hypothetical protein ABII12_05600 [Planctomycetota bacterium]